MCGNASCSGPYRNIPPSLTVDLDGDTAKLGKGRLCQCNVLRSGVALPHPLLTIWAARLIFRHFSA